jgi:hypothetical protein
MTKHNRWVEAGLISAEQGEAIARFERARVRAAFVRALFGLAILVIGTGVLVLVMARWDSLSDLAKLGGHALLNLGAIGIVWRGLQGDRVWLREGGLGLTLGLNLSFLVLLASVLGREGAPAVLLGVWMLLSSPAVLGWGRSPWLAAAWTLSCLVTVAALLFEWADALPDPAAFLLFFSASLLVPLVLLGVGTATAIQKWRPIWSMTWRRASWWLFLVGASSATAVWYVGLGDSLREMTSAGMATAQLWMSTVAVTALAMGLAFALTRPSDRRPHARADRAISLLSLGVMAVPALLFAGDVGLVGALLFIAFWGAIGWIGVGEGSDLLTGLAVWLIAARVLVLTLEYLGGMFATGLGLVVGGVLILALLRITAALQARLRQVRSGDAAVPPP